MVKREKKKKILVQVACILLSFGLWVYINAFENPIGQRTISNVPVEILNQSVLTNSGLALAPNQKLTVSLNIKGPSEKVFNSNASEYKVILQLGNTQLTTGSNWLTAQVFGGPAGVTVSNQLIKVNLKLDPLIKKEFTVKSDLDINTVSGVSVKGITFTPSVVTVEGAATTVNSVSKVVAKQNVSGLNSAQSVSAKLIALDSSGKELDDVNIYPGTVEADISTYNSKTVPVRVATNGSAPSGITISSISSSMKSVVLTGDAGVIKDINSISTEPVNLDNVKSSCVIPAKLVLPKGVSLVNGIKDVNVTISVANDNGKVPVKLPDNGSGNKGENSNEDNIEKTFEVPVNMTGGKSGYKYTLSNSTVSVVLKGPKNLIDNINLSTLASNIDVSNLTGTTTVKIEFNTIQGINVVSVNPSEVTITVTKEQEKISSNSTSRTIAS